MRFLPRLVTHNASLKFAALAAAVFLWAITPSDRTERESLTSVPVRVQVADLDWRLAEAPFPAEVSVRLSGPAREMIRLAREGATVRVPVETVLDADTTLSLRRDWVTLGSTSGLVVDEIQPGSVELRFEAVASAVLAVDLRLAGSLPEGLSLEAAPTVTPEVVRARGPERLLGGVEVIGTRVLDLADITESGSRYVPLDTAGLGLPLLDRREVSVTFRVGETVDRDIAAAPLRFVGPSADQYAMNPGAVPVRVEGAAQRVGSVDPGELGLVVDTRNIGILPVGESRRVPVEVLDPPAFLRVTPLVDSVTVTLRTAGGGG
jgi:YbbR domain-containing protein